jgi:hypothetical protein
LANEYPDIARKNLENIPFYTRWDNLWIACENTPVEKDALSLVEKQLIIDISSKTPSLLAKWLPSENTSSKETKRLANKIRNYLGYDHKEYRQTLSALRKKINVLERLMSTNQWDKIEFDAIPSKAGLIYKNAFARNEVTAAKYAAFMADKSTKVNSSVLYPYEIVYKATQSCSYWGNSILTKTDREALEKYWNNLPDYLEGKPCKMMCVVDTSGSMCGGSASAPINVAIGLGMYCAERIGGDFKNHYISFSSRPQFINIEGVDFVDKVQRIYRTNLCDNTDLGAVFKMLKEASLKAKPEDRLDTIVVISDMQIDYMSEWSSEETLTEMECIHKEWADAGLEMPRLVYWNVNAGGNANILDKSPYVSFVSGFSPTVFKQILTGKNGIDLMRETLLNERYDRIAID